MSYPVPVSGLVQFYYISINYTSFEISVFWSSDIKGWIIVLVVGECVFLTLETKLCSNSSLGCICF